jgi:hypothetical protein
MSMDYITELPEALAKALCRDDLFDIQSIKTLATLKHDVLLYWGEHKFFSFAEALCLFLYNMEQQGIIFSKVKNIESEGCYDHYFQHLLNNWLMPLSVSIPLFDDSLLLNVDKYTLALKSLKQRYQQFLYELVENEKPLELVACYQHWLKLCEQVWKNLIEVELQKKPSL